MSRKYSYQDIKEVINNVRICSMLYLAKNSKIYSIKAEEFIDRFGATRPKRDEKFAKMYNQAKISKDEKIKKKTFYNDIF